MPYYQKNISIEKIDNFFSTLKKRGLLLKDDRKHYSGLDSARTYIYINDHGVRLLWDSWHELFEGNPGCIVTEGTVEALEGRDRNEVLAKQSSKYKKFRVN